MNVPTKLASFAAVLAVIFVAAWFAGNAWGPVVSEPADETSTPVHGTHDRDGSA